MQIPTELLPWPTDGVRRASINSFGYGGTNAHCIIDDAYHYLSQRGLQGAHNTVIKSKVVKPSRPRNGVLRIDSDATPTAKPVDDPIDVDAVPHSPSVHGSETSDPPTSNAGSSESDEAIPPAIPAEDVVAIPAKDVVPPVDASPVVVDSIEAGPIAPVVPVTPSTNDIDVQAVSISADTDYPRLLIWSSHEQKGTERRAATLLSYLNNRDAESAADGEADLLDRLVYTLSNKRSRFQWRSFAVVSTLDAARSALTKPPKPLRALDTPVLAFVFTGQGAQWYAMGRELMAYRVYKESIEAASAYMKTIGAEWDLVGTFSSSPCQMPDKKRVANELEFVR